MKSKKVGAGRPEPSRPEQQALLYRSVRMIVGSDRLRFEIRGPRFLGLGSSRLLPATAMAGDTTLATGIAGLFAGPLVRGSLLVGSLAALAGNLALLASIHRSESTIFLCHGIPPSRPGSFVPRRALHGRPNPQLCNHGATNTLICLKIATSLQGGRRLPMPGRNVPNGGGFQHFESDRHGRSEHLPTH